MKRKARSGGPSSFHGPEHAAPEEHPRPEVEVWHAVGSADRFAEGAPTTIQHDEAWAKAKSPAVLYLTEATNPRTSSTGSA